MKRFNYPAAVRWGAVLLAAVVLLAGCSDYHGTSGASGLPDSSDLPGTSSVAPGESSSAEPASPEVSSPDASVPVSSDVTSVPSVSDAPSSSEPPVSSSAPVTPDGPTAEQAAAALAAARTPMRLTQSTWAKGKQMYRYDGAGRLVRVDIYEGGTKPVRYKAYTYESLANGITRMVEREYNKNGTLYSLRGYAMLLDVDGRCIQVEECLLRSEEAADYEVISVTTMVYDQYRRMASYTTTRKNKKAQLPEQTVTYRYDENGRLTEKCVDVGGTRRQQELFTRNACGDVVQMRCWKWVSAQKREQSTQSYRVTYTSNGQGRLASVTHTLADSGEVAMKQTYLYNGTGALTGVDSMFWCPEPIPGMEWLEVVGGLSGQNLSWRRIS